MIGKFVVYLTGGSIGEQTIKPRVYTLNTFDEKDAAKKAAQYKNKNCLSKGEKQYYKMKYKVAQITEKNINNFQFDACR